MTALPVFAVLLFALAIPASGLDIGLYGGAGNISFDTGKTELLSDESDPGMFSPLFFPLARAVVSGESGIISYEGGFEKNPILRSRLYANIGVDVTFFTMEVGPFFGLFNTEEVIFNPGFTAALGFQVPGIIFAKVSASSSLGVDLEAVGSYTQKTGLVSAGFWVPHVICSLNINTQTYAQKMDINMLAEDSLDRYFFRADVFSKNVPFTVKLDIGYASLKRSYSSKSIEVNEISPGVFEGKIVTAQENDEFRYVYMGLEGTFRISHLFKFYVSGEMPLYSWSVPKMKNPEKNTFFFQAMGGIILTL